MLKYFPLEISGIQRYLALAQEAPDALIGMFYSIWDMQRYDIEPTMIAELMKLLPVRIVNAYLIKSYKVNPDKKKIKRDANMHQGI